MADHADVVILGAGPSGAVAVAAAELVSAGVSVVVLERGDGPLTDAWGCGLHNA